MALRTRQSWIDLLLASAAGTLEGTAHSPASLRTREPSERAEQVAAFRDEKGHRRPVDGPFLRSLINLPFEPAPRGATLDVVLWSHLREENFAPLDAIATKDGPLNAEGTAAIEVWTERELCCVHALWAHAIARRSQRAAFRAMNAAGWLLENIQPDNATNRPWGIGVFVELGQMPPKAGESDLYAESLLHNCTVGRGKPDLLSALILHDACGPLTIVEEAARNRVPWFVAGR